MGQKKTTAKVFKNGQESPSDATLNEPVPRLIRMLACDCQKQKYFVPNQSFKASIYRAAFVIFLYERVRLPENSTARRTCLAGAGELSSGTVFSFSMKMSPQSLLYKFHSILLHHLSKKISPTLAWQVCRAGDSAWTSLVVHRLNSLIGRFSFFLLTCYIRGKISVQPKHLLCMHVFILFISTICVK